ncbi:hypothetical protein F5Y15DRAFT_74589 [Xylariaceae sp. FL0016]|nr:hypothetical protein F5Y15DRAFT_74589 [Xylariaceae sp. FL0016]
MPTVMESGEIPDHYYTYDGRLASFQSSQPVSRRASTAKAKGPKSLSWPHRTLDPDHFARAGFFFEPTPNHPDNTVCFLCLKNVGGWEENDNPFEEHLRLSPTCGWAIVAGIEVSVGNYATDDPISQEMIAARKATFAGRWPHEGKRGWKCKTKQLVDAGWKYTPTIDSDDMATCTYCALALDGWEPKDNPMDEHYRRSPECQFFRLMGQYDSAPAKKKGRPKATRGSKVSRASSQSVATAASDMTSLLDHPAEYDDSVMTTTSVATQGGTKRGRAKKATTAKGKKSRAKKDEAIEVHEDQSVLQEQAPPPPPKPTRGKKRGSDAVEDSVLTATEAPAPKKRAARGQRSNATEHSIIDQPDTSMADAPAVPLPKTRGRKPKSSNARKPRNVSSASTVSTTSSTHLEDSHVLDDEELDRQLQADMDRPLSDDEDITADSDSERKSAAARAKKASTKKSVSEHGKPLSDHAMFEPAPEIDEEAVDAELKALETEMETERVDTIEAPKKGRKAGPRKVSKQTSKKTKEKSPVPEPEPEAVLEDEAVDELAEGHDVSMLSNATVVRTSIASSTSTVPKKRGRPSKKVAAAKSIEDVSMHMSSHADLEGPATKPVSTNQQATSSIAGGSSSLPCNKSLPPLPEPERLAPPATPKAAISPAPAAKQAVVSPSQSPQSSDAENQPPSSKPSNTSTSNRVAMAPVPATPVRSSPSKPRNVFAGLQSSIVWTASDLELIFEELDTEISTSSARFLKNGADLTSPERRMTIEEWIRHNAGQAEQKLKYECEAMVTAFEKEGSKAMRALEGLIVE